MEPGRGLASPTLSHQRVRSGALEYLTFGRNEPALHHYRNTYNEALGLPPLEELGTESGGARLKAG